MAKYSVLFVVVLFQSSFPIRNQADFDKAVNLTDINERVRSMRVLLETVVPGTPSNTQRLRDPPVCKQTVLHY